MSDTMATPQKRGRKPRREERVVWLPLGELHPFKSYPVLRGIMPGNQPYHVRDDDPSMLQITATVKERGVRQPGFVRPDRSVGYEIIAGERRHRASELAGLKDMPVIVREMSDEDAVTELVDSNIQREDVLPSERAWAYRMRLEVEKRQGGTDGFNFAEIFGEVSQ